ncbi:hypothetical protein [Streptomyces sp. YIM B13518]|uniref:hypothetical protein n=1 Tax=Streptomyces sp. YIM B13518 TaxID=3366316 RepID=UPI0036A5AFDB
MSDDVLSTDPASGHDPGSRPLFNDVFQPLLSFPEGVGRPPTRNRGDRRTARRRRTPRRDVESVPFAPYEEDIAAGTYGVHAKGRVPDHPDADDFTGPFLDEGNVPDDDYDADTITESLLPRTAARSDRSVTDEDFGRIQDPVAEDVPVLPVRQAEQYAVVQDGVHGLECCLDASTVFRFRETGRS